MSFALHSPKNINQARFKLVEFVVDGRTGNFWLQAFQFDNDGFKLADGGFPDLLFHVITS
jgi:hypothetical protein